MSGKIANPSAASIVLSVCWLSISCAHKDTSTSTSELVALAKYCVQAHLAQGWLRRSFFSEENVRFSFLTHPALPFWSVNFADYTIVEVDGGKSIYGCYSDKKLRQPAQIWLGHGGPSYDRRTLLDVQWNPESYSHEEWEDYTLGDRIIAIDGMSLEELGLVEALAPK